MAELSKSELRKTMLEKRDAIPEKERTEWSEKIRNTLGALPEFRRAKCIAFYIGKGSEVDTRAMINEALEQGKKVLVPVTREEIELVEFKGWEHLKPGKFGILEPTGEEQRAKRKTRDANPPTSLLIAHSSELVIVPGLAFDERGHRVGYGKGYYDRLLKKISTVRIGICFEVQVAEEIPATESDERMDWVITEKRTIETTNGGKRDAAKSQGDSEGNHV